jgi:hypothetical protein
MKSEKYKKFGFKIFVRRKNEKTGKVGWNGPYYDIPKSWKIKEEGFLRSKTIDYNPNYECGWGINFWISINYALNSKPLHYWNPSLSHFVNSGYGKKWIMFFVGIPAESEVCIPWNSHKARSTHIRLLKRLSAENIIALNNGQLKISHLHPWA